MSNLQKRLAAKILKVGEGRVWINSKNEKVKLAITRKDVRRFIKEGIIKKVPAKRRATNKPKRQQKTGSIKGSRGARITRKARWFKVVRPQRKLLKELKISKKIDTRIYRQVYGLVKGGSFRSRSHLISYLKDKGFLKG